MAVRHQPQILALSRASIRLGVLLLVLTAFVLPTLQTPDDVSPPFRVVWNYPDNGCQSRNINFDLQKNNIVRNSNRQFIGNEIATLYTTGKYGIFPYYSNNNQSLPVNGGLPQRVNITAHLEKLLKDTLAVIAPDYKGYGVLDMEMWRPLLDLNWGAYKVYAMASNALSKTLHPTYILSQIKTAATNDFNNYARDMMQKSIEVLQAARPNVRWGFYLYPYLWPESVGVQYTNNRLSWLYRTVNGFFPSIYIKDIKSTNKAVAEKTVKDIIGESFRVRAVYGRPGSALVPYTMVQNAENVFFDESELQYAIGIPVDMGVDSVVIWGASSYLQGKGCTNVQAYVRDVLGPYVKRLTEKMTNCSLTRCMGHGRCVRQDYAQKYPYILGLNNNVSVRQVRAADPSTSGPGQVYPDMLSVLNNEPNSSPDTLEDEQLSNAEAEDLTDEIEQQENIHPEYVCQCYSGWMGPSCENPAF